MKGIPSSYMPKVHNGIKNLYTELCYGTVPGKFLGIVGQDRSDSESSRLHVDIFRFCFHSFEVYSSIDSSKMISNSPKVSNFNRYFPNSTVSSINNWHFSLDNAMEDHKSKRKFN